MGAALAMAPAVGRTEQHREDSSLAFVAELDIETEDTGVACSGWSHPAGGRGSPLRHQPERVSGSDGTRSVKAPACQ